MIIVEQGRAFEVPDSMIEHYKEDFHDMKIRHDRDMLTFFRNSVVIILAMAKKDVSLLKDPDFIGDIIRALAVKEALKQTNLLYDA